jgi:transcription elongation factor GreA
MVSAMDPYPIAMPASPPTGVVMSRVEYAVLVRELESLRAVHRRELAEQLHDARSRGSTGDNDDLLAVLEETAVPRARIAQLEDLVRYATVLDDDDATSDGAAGLGSTIEVADEDGRTMEYELIGRRTAESAADAVSLGSPVGKALAGARTGDVVHVTLPNGRDRSLTVLGIRRSAAPRLASAA